MTKILSCRYCQCDIQDDENNEGWWCASCDNFNFWDETGFSNQHFTIILEDKHKNEIRNAVPSRKFKKQLSPFRYPGGKNKMIDYLSTFLREEKCEVLASPFCGGAGFELSMLEAGVVKRLILNDLDYGVYAVFWNILNQPDALIDKIIQFKPTHSAYFEAQQLIQSDYRHLDLLDAAWVTLLVNRLAYSGISKANPLGGKNGTLEALTARWNPTALTKRIQTIHGLSDKIELHCLDAAEFVEEMFWLNRCSLFIDPPYKKGKALYNLFYTAKDHEKLANILKVLHHGFPNADIIVTYDYDNYIEDLYCTADSKEIIGRNYSI